MKIPCFAVAGLLLGLASAGFAQTKTWTTTADFNEGAYVNTNANDVPDQVQLNPVGRAPVPFLNLPVGEGNDGRLVRVNTQTGQVVGVYRAVPIQFQSRPSRCAVDSQGNAWVTTAYGSHVVAVTKIGVIVGGIRGRKGPGGQFIEDPNGEYVKDWTFTTGVDRDGDGLIRTSRGRGNLLAWNATAGNDLDSSIPDNAPGTVREAEDELILVFKRHKGSNGLTRGVSVDSEDRAIVAYDPGASNAGLLILDKTDGRILRDISLGSMEFGYFVLADQNLIWTSIPGKVVDTDASDQLTSIGANTAAWYKNTDGNLVAYDYIQNRVLFVDRAAKSISRSFASEARNTRTILVTRDSSIWVANRGSNIVIRYRQDGTVVSRIPVGNQPCGMGLDEDGFVWVSCIGDTNVFKIDPAANGGLGAVVGTVNIGDGSYNYSDGTGAIQTLINRNGRWSAVYESCVRDNDWSKISWNAAVPDDTSLRLFVRAANTAADLLNQNFVPATNGADPGVTGKFIEVYAEFERLNENVTDTPKLFDVTVESQPQRAAIEIEPGKNPNRVFLGRDYTLYVIAFGSATLNVDDIIANTVRFGRTGFEAEPVRAGIKRDWNGDGIPDLLLGFKTQKCGFQLGDTQAFLTFQTPCGVHQRLSFIAEGPVQVFGNLNPDK